MLTLVSEEVEKKYRDVQTVLGNALDKTNSVELAGQDENAELQGIRQTLESLNNEFQGEIEKLKTSSEWDKFCIAFFGETNAGKSTLLKVIIDKDRVSAIEAILKSYKSLLNEKNNVVEGVAITAIAMTNDEIKELECKLSSKYNKNVTLENKVDESVLGGVLVRLGNEEIDGTVKTRLAKMKEQLSQVIS